MTEAVERTRYIVCGSRDLARWDLKSAYAAAFRRTHPSFVPLSTYLEEATETVSPAREPDHEWPVYGVSNAKGVTFSHHQPGKKFNSSYKRIRKDWFFHNPTRANVGSLGRVPEVPGDAITSPEYQVWRIREGLLPEYMELLMGLPFFLQQVQFNRVGAVKERLFTDNLMQILVPPLEETDQRAAVEHWWAAQERASALQAKAEKATKKQEEMLLDALGTPPPVPLVDWRRWWVAEWSEMDRWSVAYLENARQGRLGFVHSRYAIEPLGEHLVGTMSGLSTKPSGRETGFWTLKLNALTPDGLDLTAVKPAPVDADTARRFSLVKDDLLICRSVGSFDQVAKCALIEEDAPTILFPDIIIRARMKNSLLPAYVREVVQSPVGRSFFQANARTAVGMWKIGADDIRNFPIPVPPEPVQEAIVEQMRVVREATRQGRDEAAATLAQAKSEVETMILERRKVESSSNA